MFKRITLASLALVLMGTTAASAWTRIRTEAEFRAQIVGRNTVIEGRGGTVQHADGTVTGTWDGQAVRGRWSWSDGMYCRNLNIGGRVTGTDCLEYFIDGNRVRAVRDYGRGAEIFSTIE
jgi:hypothetical protein